GRVPRSRGDLLAGRSGACEDPARDRGQAQRRSGEGTALARCARADEPDRLRRRRRHARGVRPLHEGRGRPLDRGSEARRHQARMNFMQENLARAIEAIVAAGGSDAREAELVARNLVTANLLGHDSHGIGMIPRYVDALREGGLVPNREPAVRLDLGTLLVLDGQTGYGQSIGHQATRMAIERAKRQGSCIMALGNAHHLGRIGHWAEMAVAEGLVSVHFANVLSYARVAPYGGADGRFGTNPFCVGIPLPGEPPFMLDMATSAVAQGKLRVAHN